MMPRSIPLLLLSLVLQCAVSAVHAAEASGADPETFSPAELHADFEELRAILYASHFDAFVERTRTEMNREFDRVSAQLDAPMSRADAALLFQRFVAYGNVAHARVEDAGLAFGAHVDADGLIVPFNVRVVDGSMYIADIYPGGDDLEPGDRLVSINGHPVPSLRAAMHGDLSADNAYLADTLLEFEFPRVLWQQIGAPEQYSIVVERDAVRVALELAGNLPSERRSILDDGYLWLSWSARNAEMRSCDTAYLRPGPFYNPDGDMWDTTSFDAFIDRSFERFLEDGAQRLLIDLRNNPGGDASFSDHMLAWFADEAFRFHSSFRVRNSAAARDANDRRLADDEPSDTTLAYDVAYREQSDGAVFDFETPMVAPRAGQRFEGDVFVLVNRHSYSNAVTTAAIVQDYGFGSIIGEASSDLATTLGAMEQFTLNHTGLRVGFPKARIVRPNGDERRIGVQPDIAIETPLVEPASDPVLERALEIACGGTGSADS